MKPLDVRSGRLGMAPVQLRPSRPTTPSTPRLAHTCLAPRRHRAPRYAAIASAATALAPSPNAVQVSFFVPFQTKFGESLRIVGSDECVGSWNVDAGPLLQWSEGDIWTATISVTPGTALEYKLVWQSLNGVEWESIPNRTVCLDADVAAVRVDCLWNTPDAVVSPSEPSTADADEDDDAAQVAAMQVTAVVDGMLSTPLEPGEDGALVKDMLNGYKNGGSVNEVYATIALDALESADGLTTLEEAQAAVDTLVGASGLCTSRMTDQAASVQEAAVAVEEAAVAQVAVEEVAVEEVAPVEEVFDEGARLGDAAAMDEAVARAAVELETAAEETTSAEATVEEEEEEVEEVDKEEVEEVVAAPVTDMSKEASDAEAAAAQDMAAVVADDPKASPGGLQLPAALAKAGKTFGYVALGLGAAAALGAVAVDTAAVDAALASALMAAVIIGDDGTRSKQKDQAEEGAELDDAVAPISTEQGPPADAAPTRRTAPSATPGLLLAIAVFAAADVVKAVTASPAKRADEEEAAPAAAKAKATTKPVVKATTKPVVKATTKPVVKVVPTRAPTTPDAAARSAAMLRRTSDTKTNKEEEEVRNNVLMAWFRANPAKDAAEDKAARPARARPPKPAPVTNNKYPTTGANSRDGKAKWWGL